MGSAASWSSVGKVYHFTGDIYPTPALVQALKARSYRNEIVFITDTRIHAALQTYGDLAAVGVANVIWLTSDEGVCQLAKPFLGIMTDGSMPGTINGAAFGAKSKSGDSAAGTVKRNGRVMHRHGDQMQRHLQAARGLGIGSDAGTAPAAELSNALACTWYSQPFPHAFSGHRRLMMKRIMLMARAVRLGYNALNMDTDVLVFRNPYPYLKAPPFDAFHLVVGRGMRSGMVNTGLLYAQNATRHGPVAWLLAEVVQRNLHWIEQSAASGGGGGAGGASGRPVDARGCWDQYLFTDVMLTGMLGKLVFWHCLRPAAGAGAKLEVQDQRPGKLGSEPTTGPAAEWDAKHKKLLGIEERNLRDIFVHDVVSVEGDEQMSHLVASQTYHFDWVNVTVPHGAPPLLPEAAAAYNGKGGGGGVGGKGGAGGGAELSSDAFQKALQEDTLHVELRRGRRRRRAARLLQQAAVGGGAAPRMERIAYAPDWLIGSWPTRGALGYWDPEMTAKPRAVLGHLARAPGPTGIGKEAVRMAYGLYDWPLARRLAGGGPSTFIGSTHTGVLPRVIAYAPSVDLTVSNSGQFSAAVRGLAQIALLTGRVMVWPEIPCASKWLQRNPNSRRALPIVPSIKFFVHGELGKLRCGFMKMYHNKCLYERKGGGAATGTTQSSASSLALLDNPSTLVAAARGEAPAEGLPTGIEGQRGLLLPEFELLLEMLGAAGKASDANTMRVDNDDDYDAGERPVIFDEPARTEGITYVRARDVLATLHRYDDQPVMYLGQLTSLTKLDKLANETFAIKYREWKHECPGLLK